MCEFSRPGGGRGSGQAPRTSPDPAKMTRDYVNRSSPPPTSQRACESAQFWVLAGVGSRRAPGLLSEVKGDTVCHEMRPGRSYLVTDDALNAGVRASTAWTAVGTSTGRPYDRCLRCRGSVRVQTGSQRTCSGAPGPSLRSPGFLVLSLTEWEGGESWCSAHGRC